MPDEDDALGDDIVPTVTPLPRCLGQFFSRLSTMCAIPRAYSLDLKSIRRAMGDATAATVRATYAAMTVNAK